MKFLKIEMNYGPEFQFYLDAGWVEHRDYDMIQDGFYQLQGSMRPGIGNATAMVKDDQCIILDYPGEPDWRVGNAWFWNLSDAIAEQRRTGEPLWSEQDGKFVIESKP